MPKKTEVGTTGQPSVPEEEQPKHKTNLIFAISGLIIVILWALAYTDALNIIRDSVLAGQIKQTLLGTVGIITIVYLLVVIATISLRGKVKDIITQEKNIVLIVEPHTQLQPIRKIARENYGIQLEKCVRILSNPALGEASSVPPVRYFVFENIVNGRIADFSMWKQAYVKKITTDLVDAHCYKRDSQYRRFTGESYVEVTKALRESISHKKRKDVPDVQTQEEQEEESLTG